MGRQAWEASEARFGGYVDGLTRVIGHADRAAPLKGYCTGLLAAEGRRSVEPMAAVTAPAGVSAQHQRLLHFVANSAWSDEAVLAKVQEMVVPAIERHGPIEAWIIDDTSFPKQGKHSVGVHHQYCGQLGKQANCQVVVTLSVANHHASLPIAYRLYLPEAWTEDAARRKKARIPEEITFKTKPEIALEQIRAALAAGVARGAVLMDASYGSNSALRNGVSALALSYVAGIVPTIKVQAVTGSGKPNKRWGSRIDAKALALGLPTHAWRKVAWREGTNERLSSRFARVRVRTSPIRGAKERAEETLLIEWPEGEAEPTKYWLSTLPKGTSFRKLVDIAKMRWRIERDYHDLKQEIGLGHYEGRGWTGFHHHGTLCIAAYGFLVSERETIPPSEPARAGSLAKPALPDGYRPRGGGYYFNVGCSDLVVERKIGLVQLSDIAELVADGALMRGGDLVAADLVVLATGYKGLDHLVAKLFGDAVAARVGPVWGFGDSLELRNMFTRTPQPGLWFIAGSLAQCRIYSKHLAQQIVACEAGLLAPTRAGVRPSGSDTVAPAQVG